MAVILSCRLNRIRISYYNRMDVTKVTRFFFCERNSRVKPASSGTKKAPYDFKNSLPYLYSHFSSTPKIVSPSATSYKLARNIWFDSVHIPNLCSTLLTWKWWRDKFAQLNFSFVNFKNPDQIDSACLFQTVFPHNTDHFAFSFYTSKLRYLQEPHVFPLMAKMDGLSFKYFLQSFCFWWIGVVSKLSLMPVFCMVQNYGFWHVDIRCSDGTSGMFWVLQKIELWFPDLCSLKIFPTSRSSGFAVRNNGSVSWLNVNTYYILGQHISRRCPRWLLFQFFDSTINAIAFFRSSGQDWLWVARFQAKKQ